MLSSRLLKCTLPCAVSKVIGRWTPSSSSSVLLSALSRNEIPTQPLLVSSAMAIHTSAPMRDLMEFFEAKDNWGKSKIIVGRSWTQDELRLKSNEDLHKLWFVLLKERNMLYTMELAYKNEFMNMPNPERIDKVEESMENLEFVVRERNRAYYELETGDSGERERYLRPGPFGFLVGYKDREHFLPWQLNSSYRAQLRLRFHTSHGKPVRTFLAKYIEILHRRARHESLVQMRIVSNILKRFPDADEEAIREKYPLVNVGLVKRWKKSLSHSANEHLNV